MAGVNQTTGVVDINAYFRQWNNGTIEEALKTLRKEMESPNFKKLKQPEDGLTY